MSLERSDSLQYLAALVKSDDVPPDVIYLDPMFPATPKSAAVKKKFQLLHVLENPAMKQKKKRLSALRSQPIPARSLLSAP